MGFDASVSLRLVHNERLQRSRGWCVYRDLGGALAATSDAPTAALNCIEGFTTDDARIEGLLDIGFALLRAFDREPAALVTPLDRPASLAERLQHRGLQPTERSVTLALRDAAPHARAARGVDVRRATPDDAQAVARLLAAAGPKWLRRLATTATLDAIIEADTTFYLGYADGEAAGTLQLLRDGATAGVYGAATAKAHRRRGIGSALLAAAIVDARAAGCGLVGARTDAESEARPLFEAAGFAPAHESALWTLPERA
ncbi:MAG TPA: GNAT family N-acetyltransferase [Dehalococcoidia bacterium]|nr:GNAT family N-acetyltransferase [Dehalococcoidia bacterium]